MSQTDTTKYVELIYLSRTQWKMTKLASCTSIVPIHCIIPWAILLQASMLWTHSSFSLYDTRTDTSILPYIISLPFSAFHGPPWKRPTSQAGVRIQKKKLKILQPPSYPQQFIAEPYTYVLCIGIATQLAMEMHWNCNSACNGEKNLQRGGNG